MTYLSIFVVIFVVFVVVFPFFFFCALKDLQITEELHRFTNFVIL